MVRNFWGRMVRIQWTALIQRTSGFFASLKRYDPS
jgi:hypothetical protein